MSHLFVALPLPDWIRRHLQSRSQAVKKEFSFQRWAHPEDYHLTLFFFGEVAGHKQDDMITCLERVAAQPEIRSFSLQIAQWGIFGREQQPRVLWAGVKGELDRLSALQLTIKEAMKQVGFPIERRPFRPHITVAKKCRQPNFSLPLIQSKYSLENHSWAIHKMVLYRTHLQKQPHYQEVIQFPFNAVE